MDEVPVLISNIDVMLMLNERLKKRPKNKKRQPYRQRDWVEKEVAAYLESTPCATLHPKRCRSLQNVLQSQKKNRFSMESSKSTGFGLTEAEAIEILNLVPSEPVELHLIVEELQSRLSERQQEELLALVATHRDSAEISKTEPEPEAEDLIEEDAAALEQDNGGEATFLPIETEINAATTVVKMEPPSIKQEE